jgi:hypothetical protein
MPKLLGAAVLAPIVLVGCARAGLGPDVRTDVTARVESTAPTLSECYAQALRDDRKLAGRMVVAFVAAPSSGAFQDVQVIRDDLGHAGLQQCVIEAIAALRLASPQKTTVSVTYPLDFAPTR